MSEKNERTLFCGNLSDKVTEELLYELFLQAGPVESVKIPKDHRSGKNKNYAFVVFKHKVSVPYTIALLQGTCLYDKMIQLDYKSGAGPATNPYLQTLEAYRAATGNPRMPSHSASAYPDEMYARSSFHGFSPPAGDYLHDYNSNRMRGRMEMPQSSSNEELRLMPPPNYRDGRLSQRQAHQSSYERSSSAPSTSSHRRYRHDHKDSSLRSSRDRKYH